MLFENQLFPSASEENSGLAVLIREQSFCHALMDVSQDCGSRMETELSKRY